jgi:hypothetical protein
MIKIDELSNEIARTIQEYSEDVEQAVQKVLDKDSTELVNKLKATSPKKTGEYAKGWTKKKSTLDGRVTYTVYNKDRYQLTHLLEFGHAKRSGGRVPGQPHIGPARDEIEEKIVRDIEAAVRGR